MIHERGRTFVLYDKRQAYDSVQPLMLYSIIVDGNCGKLKTNDRQVRMEAWKLDFISYHRYAPHTNDFTSDGQ